MKPLAAMLKAAGVTQEDAAHALGKSQPAVSRIVNGTEVPSVADLKALARLLDVERGAVVAAWIAAAMQTARKRAAKLAASDNLDTSRRAR